MLHGRCNTLAQAVIAYGVESVDGHLVDYYLNIVVLIAVNLHAPLYFEHLAIHAYIEVSLASHAFE